MEGKVDAHAVLDCAAFQIFSTENRYEALVCSKGKTEKIDSGPLDQLLLHLPELKGKLKGFQSEALGNNFKLQLTENLRGSSWFTKLTVARFLHLVNAPAVLRNIIALNNELSQLEETRTFHLALHAKDLPDHSGGLAADGCLKELGVTEKITGMASSDATKNELLRAMDLRLLALRDELVATFKQAIGAISSTKLISDLSAFCQHYGAIELRTALLNFLALIPKEDHSDPPNDQSTYSHHSRNTSGKVTGNTAQLGCQNDVAPSTRTGVSLAKIAQAERQSSSENEDSSDSHEDSATAERSRSVIRSASPRRSASPMRRIQIGRSGSRRSTALTIRSLSYFPARERTYNQDADENCSGDEESNQPSKKPENTVRRMSVQDAISLFEGKQKDPNLDPQKSRASVETCITANKSVLRRWSAGMGDSIQTPQENISNCGFESNNFKKVPEIEEKNPTETRPECDAPSSNLKPVENTEESGSSSQADKKSSAPVDNAIDVVVFGVKECEDKAMASAEWTRQKEAELNQMLMKMMESKPTKYQSTTALSDGNKELSSEHEGGFYRQYQEKRHEKLRVQNAGKQGEKEARVKVMQETFDQRKAETALKAVGLTRKHDLLSKKSPRKSSPPVLPKKETTQPASLRKVSPKPSSPLPATRSSWSSSTSTRTTGAPQTKTSPRMVAANSTPNHRKPQPTPSPTRPGPRTDRSLRQPKNTKTIQTETKSSLQGQEEKQKKITKINKIAKTRITSASGDDNCAVMAKPSFYNKVTKKSSVVPLESKPFLRKGTGTLTTKTKLSQSDDLSRESENIVQTEGKESVAGIAETISQLAPQPLEQAAVQLTSGGNACPEDPVNNDLRFEDTEELVSAVAKTENVAVESIEFPVVEIQAEEDLAISPAAWVDINQQGVDESCDNGYRQFANNADVAPAPLSSPRVRHSLSQMLLADSSEPEIIEWGNAENPPALVYQKDSPKGLKRLLKFARKSKGEASATGWASPSVFSEGEEDADESKATNKRNVDTLQRKAALQTKGFGHQKTVFCEGHEGGKSHLRSMDSTIHDILSAQSQTSNVRALSSYKMQEGHNAAASTSSRASRSFFSLSTFRSSKSSETKLR